MFQLEKLERIIRGDASGINVYAYNTADGNLTLHSATLVIARVHKGG